MLSRLCLILFDEICEYEWTDDLTDLTSYLIEGDLTDYCIYDLIEGDLTDLTSDLIEGELTDSLISDLIEGDLTDYLISDLIEGDLTDDYPLSIGLSHIITLLNLFSGLLYVCSFCYISLTGVFSSY